MFLKTDYHRAFMFCFCSCVLLVSANHCFAEKIAKESTITDVTVYPGSARVTRAVAVELSVGEHSIVLENIVPQFDENTLSVNGKGTAEVKIFGAYLKREYTKVSADDRVQELQSKIENLDEQIQQTNDALQVIKKEQEFLDSVKMYSGQKIPEDLVTTMPSVEYLEGIRGFLSERFSDIKQREQAAKLKIRDLKREKTVLQRKLSELRSSGGQQQRLLVVDLECVKSGMFTLNVSYLVPGASWRAVYDARAHYDAQEVELTFFGMIKQTTGEDWQDVQLTLSTAQPTVSGRMPYVGPWVLQPYQPRTRATQALGRGMADKAMAPDLDEFQHEAFYLREDAAAPEPVEAEASLAFSQMEQKGVSVVYRIGRPVTIKSDGSENKYPVSAQVLKADFEYSSYPRVKPFAYLGSRVTNSKDLQLLAGQVNLFLDGDFVGKSSIDNIGPGEEFDLYLGVDENVKVKREQLSRNVDDVLIGGIKSPNRTTTYTYKLTVENYKDKNITVHLFEAVPVSQNDRIKVKTFDVSRKPDDKNWKDRQGIWRWEFTLKPKQRKEIQYSFSVDHARNMNIPGI